MTSTASTFGALDEWSLASVDASKRRNINLFTSRNVTNRESINNFFKPVNEGVNAMTRYASHRPTSYINTFFQPSTDNITKFTRPPKTSTSTKSKTDVELISDAILTDQPVKEKISTLLSNLAIKHPDVDKDTLLSRTYAAIWANARPLIYSLVASTIIAITIAVVQTYFGAGSWLSFLEILRNLGIKILPGVVFKILKGAGVSLGSSASINVVIALAEKNRTVARLLSKQVKPAFLLATLRTVGIDISNYDLSLKNIARTAIANGAAAGAGDLNSFFINAGIKAGVSVSSKVAAKAKEGIVKTIHTMEKVVKETVDTVLPDDVRVEKDEDADAETKDAISITRKVEEKVLRRKIKSPLKEVKNPEMSKSVKEMVDDNKAIIAGSTVALVLGGLAFTTDPSVLADTFLEMGKTLGMKVGPELLNIAKASGLNYAWENAAARSTLFSILANQVGIQKAVDSLVDFLTPDQLVKLKSLSTTLAKERTRSDRLARSSKLGEFFSLLIGEQIYSRAALERFEVSRLKEIARVKNIKFPGDVAKASLVEAIEKDQRYRTDNISKLVAQSIFTAIKQTTTLTAMEYAYQNLHFQGLTTVEEIDKELKYNEEMKAKQEALMKEKTQAREARRAKMAPVYEERRVEAEKAVEISRKLKAAQAEVNVEKLASRLAERQLADSARLQDLAKKMNIVISDTEGKAFPIPVDELLVDPRLAKVLGEVEFTPLAKYLTMEAAKSSINWVPGLGYVNQAINTANWVLDVGEKVKDVYKVVNVAVEMVNGESKLDVGAKNIETLDWLLKKRLPNLGDAIGKYVGVEKVNMKVLLLETLRDKILYQWDSDKVALELGKKVLGKEAVEMASSTLLNVGRGVWEAIGVAKM